MRKLLLLLILIFVTQTAFGYKTLRNTVVDDKLGLREQTSHPTITASGVGFIYSRDDNDLYYIDENNNISNVLLGGASTLDDLLDVNYFGLPILNEMLVWDGLQWRNQATASLTSLVLGGGVLDANSIFQINSITDGAIPCPKMTEVQRDAIIVPTNGLCVYNTDTNELNTYNSLKAAWVLAGGSADAIAAHEIRITQNEADIALLNTASASYVLIDGSRDVEGDLDFLQSISVANTVTASEYKTSSPTENMFYTCSGDTFGSLTTGNKNVFHGCYTDNPNITSGVQNVVMGYNAGKGIVGGSQGVYIGAYTAQRAAGASVGVGFRALQKLVGAYDVGVGSYAFYNLQAGNYNTCMGYQCFYSATTGGRRVGLGAFAGHRTTEEDVFVIDNRMRASVAEEKTNAIFYGKIAAAPADSYLNVNAHLVTFSGSATIADDLTVTKNATISEQLTVGATFTLETVTIVATKSMCLSLDGNKVVQSPVSGGGITDTGTLSSANDGITIVGNGDELLEDASITLNMATTGATGGLTANAFRNFNAKDSRLFGYYNAESGGGDAQGGVGWGSSPAPTSGFIVGGAYALKGEKGYRITNVTGSASDYRCSPDVTLPAYGRGQFIGIRMDYSYDGDTNDIKMWLEDVTNSASISSEFLESGSKKVLVAGFTQSTTALVKACWQIHTVNNGKNLDFDNVEFVVNPLRDIKLKEIETYRAKEPCDSLSSTAGEFRFSASVVESGNSKNLISKVDDVANARTRFVANKDIGKVTVVVSARIKDSGSTLWIAINGVSTQMGNTISVASHFCISVWTGSLNKGDYITFGAGLSTGLNTGEYCQTSGASNTLMVDFSYTAEADTDATVHGSITDTATNYITPATQTCNLRDEKSAGTAGGTSSSAAFATRTLNTTQGDCSFISLSSNEFTISQGKYELNAVIPFNQTTQASTRLYNVTDGVIVDYGMTCYSDPSATVATTSTIDLVLNPSKTTTYRIEYIVNTSRAGDGLGRADFALGGKEVYTTVKITKVK